MKAKKIIIILAGIAVILLVRGALTGHSSAFPYFLQKAKDLRATIVFDSNTFSSEEPIKVAACPTFYYMADKLEVHEELSVVRTQSTAESLVLLGRGEVDLIISGRPLKRGDPELVSRIIGPGYDFIFEQEIAVLEKEINSIPFYTDLSLNKVVQDFDYISKDNLTKVEDPYQYLDRGVVITSLERINRGEIVHVFKEDGSRLRMSRMPRIYCFLQTPEEKVELVARMVSEI